MIKKIRTLIITLIIILKIKWVKGACRHFCCMCQYRNQCYDNFEVEYDDLK